MGGGGGGGGGDGLGIGGLVGWEGMMVIGYCEMGCSVVSYISSWIFNRFPDEDICLLIFGPLQPSSTELHSQPASRYGLLFFCIPLNSGLGSSKSMQALEDI